MRKVFKCRRERERERDKEIYTEIQKYIYNRREKRRI